MTIKIGDRSVATRRTRDTDAALIAATGCSATEFAAMLRANPTSLRVAQALAPFVTGDDAPTAPELAAMIEAAGATSVAPQVIALLDATVPAAPPETSK